MKLCTPRPSRKRTSCLVGCVDIDLAGIQFQVQHKCRVAAVVQHVAVGLFDRMRHQPVADMRPLTKKYCRSAWLREKVAGPPSPTA